MSTAIEQQQPTRRKERASKTASRGGGGEVSTKRQLWELGKQVHGWTPLTLAGVALLGVSLFGYLYYGQDKADYVLYSAGIVGMALVGVALVFVVVGVVLLWVMLPVRGSAQELMALSTGEVLLTGFRVPNMKWWPLVEVSMRWESPAHIEMVPMPQGRHLEELIKPKQRGHVREIKRSFEVRDIFGLAAFRFAKAWPVEMKVAPAAAQVDLSVALRDVTGDGYSHPAGQPEGELSEMRRYTPGDPLRLVLWKVFARSRRLLVRVPERAVMPQRSTIAVMLAGPDDEATASVARTFIEQGLLGSDFQFFADGAEAPAKDQATCIEHLIDSAQAKGAGGGLALERLLAQVDRGQLGNCIVFAPASAGPWMERLAAFAQQVSSPPAVVIGVDGELGLGEKRGLLARVFLASGAQVDRGEREVLRGLPKLHDTLAHMGGPVRIIHRQDGHLMDHTALEGLRSLG